MPMQERRDTPDSQTIASLSPLPQSGPQRTDASQYGGRVGYVIERYHRLDDVPLEEARDLLVEYAIMMHARVVDHGGPDFDWRDHVNSFMHNFPNILPPNGSYLMARDAQGALVGTATLMRVSEDTGEMKHLYVRPEGRRTGLGEALVRARIDDARSLGLRWLVADTFKINRELPALYAKLGFDEVVNSGMSKSAAISPQVVDWMWFYRLDLQK
ncbi:GNAT superfamily N-acetyltransferase [Rubricella aquisinus]|uniref:GNAT superfamily N-acetyltransferase n=1 Tax=Rubricella aquisinus TaxID=2028108 RepID=A0A840X0X2_9RHOB|nr:GNAT family N-acetyltransferase [Rubricella aquisinus]MBB5515526.1 GNAT superfamily N-acetyltransferase [Rubricella aquisinus]